MGESVLRDYEVLLRRAVRELAEEADAVRVPDPARRWVPGAAHAVYRPMMTLAMAYFDPVSPRRGEAALWHRMEEAAGAFRHFQHEDGLIDLGASNFHSAPDAAFMVEDLVVLYEVLRDCAEPSARREEFLARLESIIVPACEGIARGGVHTPNHRWKAASALALADRLWPHETWRAEAQAYLDEGIDIDEDGEFTERSTGCYNYVCDRALILLGRTLGRKDYFALADRNLEHMLYLLHADGTLVTSYSRRQDRGTTVGVDRYLLLYWYRAMMGGDGRFGSAAELCLRRIDEGRGTVAGLARWLRYFREAGEKPPLAPEPLPEDYEARFDAAGVLRRRRGGRSLTLMAGWDDVLAVRFGAGPEITLRIAAAFAPRGQFRAEGIEGRDGRYRLRSHHACEYYGPGPDALPAGDWRSRESFSRRVFVGAELTMHLDVEPAGGGLRLRLHTAGCPRVPVEAAFVIRDAEEVEATGELEFHGETRKHFLNAGELMVRGRGHMVRVGPGVAEHDLPEIPTAGALPAHGAYCIRPVTPADVTIHIRPQPR